MKKILLTLALALVLAVQFTAAFATASPTTADLYKVELAKPDGARVVAPGTELDTIADLPARAIPGVGPATMERLARLGIERARKELAKRRRTLG